MFIEPFGATGVRCCDGSGKSSLFFFANISLNGWRGVKSLRGVDVGGRMSQRGAVVNLDFCKT